MTTSLSSSEREQRLERVELRERRLALPERKLQTVVPPHVHPGAARARDIARRAGHEQCARRLDAQPLEGEPVWLGPGLVRACGLGCDDRVEGDADASGCALPELFGAVGHDADPHTLAQPSQNLRCLGPGAKL